MGDDKMIRSKLTLLSLLITFNVVYSGCPFKQMANSERSGRESRETREIADPETSTPNGCTCNSLCGATIEDGFTNDWCNVEGSCGEYTILIGYWDWCLYKDSSKPDNTALDWRTKHDQLWAEIKADGSYGEFFPTDAFTESLITSFENEWDVMPAGRRKAIHSVAAVCPFTIDISADSPFTGLFKTGQTAGFIRLGGATDFTSSLTPGMTPGIGVKFLRSGTSSANFVALRELSPLPDNSHNFFQATLKNHLPDQHPTDAAQLALALRFCSTGHCITKVGLSNVCTHDQDGTEYPDPTFPFQVAFEPTGDVNFPDAAPDSMWDFLNQFIALAPGTRLYTIRAMISPTESIVLGDVVTSDECVSSNFGDTKMFFKHQWIEEDIALRPEWADAYYEDCYCNTP